MQRAAIDTFPPPPAGRVGWPWTVGGERVPATMPDGQPWPRISIVTPSFNQGRFIEETIRSVLLQGYPNLEYIITDGGSTDNSVKIIHKYAPWLAHWVSEPDRGQSHAINKGMAHATGHILAYLNSDDLYMPGALQRVALTVDANESTWCCGDCRTIDANSNPLYDTRVGLPGCWVDLITHAVTIMQPSVFWTENLWKELGPLNEDMFFCFDWDLFCRFLQHGFRPRRCEFRLSGFRRHGDAKSAKYVTVARREDEQIWHDCMRRAGLRGKLRGRSYWYALRHGRWPVDVLRLALSQLIYPPSMLSRFHWNAWSRRICELLRYVLKHCRK